MKIVRITALGLLSVLLVSGCVLYPLLSQNGLADLLDTSSTGNTTSNTGGTGTSTGTTPITSDFSCTENVDTPCDVQRGLYWINRVFGIITQTWGGNYRFDTWPLYVVYVAPDNSTTGYLINGQNLPATATQVTGDAAQGLTVYRYDGDAARASQTANGLYDLFFEINGTEYSMILLTTQDASDLENADYEWIMTFVHETFHAYQIRSWQDPTGMLQDEENYPLPADVLALALLECKLAAAAYKTSDQAQSETYLKMYIAVRTEKMRIDPSQDKLVRYMDNPQEHSEGSARYIEVKAMELIDSTVPATYFKRYLDDTLSQGFSTAQDVRDMFAFAMWYETGAIALRLMDTVGVSYVDKMVAGKTPFDIAEAHYNLSAAELATQLEAAKNEFGWTQIQADAQTYANLN